MIKKAVMDIASIEQKAGKGVSMKMLLSGEEAENFAMRQFTIKAGGYMPLHTNSVEHEQFVLQGRAKVTVGDEVFEAKKGDILYIPADAPHMYETIGDEDYEFLCLVPKKEDTISILSC
ncbi:cupin domain-containing protein [Sulfurimonas sp. HSL-1716]|uniref:cupin domain-containing protein n=1 Tax=Hydrocurvibacter sulfurireducens TaxID=3131937 RepID=UPI0031F98940